MPPDNVPERESGEWERSEKKGGRASARPPGGGNSAAKSAYLALRIFWTSSLSTSVMKGMPLMSAASLVREAMSSRVM